MSGLNGKFSATPRRIRTRSRRRVGVSKPTQLLYYKKSKPPTHVTGIMYFEDLKRLIDAQITDYKNLLGSGVPEDYPSYCQYVGTISGLEWSRNLVAEIQKRTAEGEED